MALPKSVRAINRTPIWANAAFALGTKIHYCIEMLRDLHTLLISGGALSEILLDAHDQAYNACLVDPDWKQNTGGGGNTQMENGTAIDCIVNGIYSAAHYAATQDVAISATANTTAGQYKAVTLSLTGAGALTQTVSAAATAAPVQAPRPPSGEVPVGVIQIPASFTTGVTVVQTAWFTQGYPRRSSVYTPITSTAPDSLPNTDA